jgi:hypothetical protein
MSDPVNWTTHPTADFDRGYWRDQLIELNRRYPQRVDGIWHIAEQYALHLAEAEQIKLLNKVRREIDTWRTKRDPDTDEVRALDDVVTYLDDKISRLGGHFAETVGKES